TPTPAPTPTPEPTPQPTPTPELTPTEVPTEVPPVGGTPVYEADWATGADGWELTDGWQIVGGDLIASGAEAAPLQSPFQPEDADYAVEVEMAVTGISDCTEFVGVFARISEVAGPDGEVLTGYAGNVCADEWR